MFSDAVLSHLYLRIFEEVYEANVHFQNFNELAEWRAFETCIAGFLSCLLQSSQIILKSPSPLFLPDLSPFEGLVGIAVLGCDAQRGFYPPPRFTSWHAINSRYNFLEEVLVP